ncbi:MAG: type II toxin-antitoxin system RelE/ParE family toxin [Chloroflexi bacterium]|nr:type II toxin-antitoxin system RelE/ParE family toxin [Chloroflexota bacterium]
MYEVVLRSRRVQRELRDLPPGGFDRVLRQLQGLAQEPRPIGCEKLEDDIHRIRAGDYRIIYLVDDEARRIYVGAVRQRAETTYKGIRDLFQ